MEIYEEILVSISPRLMTDHRAGGIEKTEPNIQLLIFFELLSNQESMREVSLYFDVGMGTFHQKIGKVRRVVKECLGRVCTPSNTL